MTDPRQPYAAALRSVGLDFNRPGVLAAFDEMLDKAGVGRAAAPSPPAGTTAFDAAIVEHLRREEGVREKAYKDHLGYWTIGVGRLIDQRKGGRITAEEEAQLVANNPARKGQDWAKYVLTDAEIDMLLLNDIARFVAVISEWPAWKALKGNVARQVALTSMAFQMGHVGLSKFKNTLSLIAAGNFEGAAANMLKSAWAKQTPGRADRVAKLMRTGAL